MYYLVKITELDKNRKTIEQSSEQSEKDYYDFELFCEYCKHWNFYRTSDVILNGTVLCKKCKKAIRPCPACYYNQYALPCEDIECRPCSMEYNLFYNPKIIEC